MCYLAKTRLQSPHTVSNPNFFLTLVTVNKLSPKRDFSSAIEGTPEQPSGPSAPMIPLKPHRYAGRFWSWSSFCNSRTRRRTLSSEAVKVYTKNLIKIAPQTLLAERLLDLGERLSRLDHASRAPKVSRYPLQRKFGFCLISRRRRSRGLYSTGRTSYRKTYYPVHLISKP